MSNWRTEFTDKYDAAQRAAYEAKIEKANSTTSEFDPTATWAQRIIGRTQLVKDRLSIGFRHTGSPWGGSYTDEETGLHVKGRWYYRSPFVAAGLISETDPIFKLFLTKVPSAKGGLRTARKKSGLTTGDSKLLAMDDEWVALNKEMRGAFRIDLDQDYDCLNDLLDAVARCGVPQPNLVVCFAPDHDPLRIESAHLWYLLEHSVCFTNKGSRAAQNAYHACLRDLTASLVPAGADLGGLSNPNSGKNPLSPKWRQYVVAGVPYSLEQLRTVPELVDDCLSHLGMPSNQAVAETRESSNRYFDTIRKVAYRVSSEIRLAGGTKEEALTVTVQEALTLDLDCKEKAITKIAQGAVEWAWKHYRAKAEKSGTKNRGVLSAKLNGMNLKDRQAAGASHAAKVKRQGTIALVANAYAQLGLNATQQAIAELADVSVRTVRRVMAEARAMAEHREDTRCIDKKECIDPVIQNTSSSYPDINGEAGIMTPADYAVSGIKIVQHQHGEALLVSHEKVEPVTPATSVKSKPPVPSFMLRGRCDHHDREPR